MMSMTSNIPLNPTLSPEGRGSEGGSAQFSLAPLGEREGPADNSQWEGEGIFLSLKCNQDSCQNAIHVPNDIIVPKTKRPVSPLGKKRVASRIMLSPVGMLSTIRLDDEATFSTKKVRDIRPKRHLPTELGIAQLSISKTRPEQRLGTSLMSPEGTCAIRIPSFHTPSPQPSPPKTILGGEGVRLQNSEDSRS